LAQGDELARAQLPVGHAVSERCASLLSACFSLSNAFFSAMMPPFAVVWAMCSAFESILFAHICS
jgi:hypothetical protein